MSKLKIHGGAPLCGEITVSGSKNAALPILFATIATRGVSRISRVPDISDVSVALSILRDFGALILREGDTLYVDSRHLSFKEPKDGLMSKIRASTYVMGASIARFGRCVVSDFGGCNFAKRPIDMHVDAFIAFGGTLSDNKIVCEKTKPASISFSRRSVGATANALILAAATEGVSHIKGYAREPHIINLVDFLRSCGAQIEFCDDEITVCGGDLHGGRIEIIGDMIEAGTYLAASVMTDGEIAVSGCEICDMSSYISFLASVGARIEISKNKILAKRGECLYSSSVTAEPYPAFPTDLQPIAGALMAVCEGGEIYDRVFPERFGYLSHLGNFGCDYVSGRGFALVKKSNIHGAEVYLPDLRGGAACLLCSLCAEGESSLLNAELLLRGYEGLESKLRGVGAKLKFV